MSFTSIKDVVDLGEVICCVFFEKYDERKAMQYMRWKGFRVDLMFKSDHLLIFYQQERFVPTTEGYEIDTFFRKIPLDIIWDAMPSGLNNTYKYRVLSKGVTCVSYIPDADIDSSTK